MTQITDQDREKGWHVVQKIGAKGELACIEPCHSVPCWCADQIAAAIATARKEAEALAQSAENDCQRAITARQKADLDLKCLQESTVDRKAWDQAVARHEVELRALQSQIAELERDRDRLRGLLRAPGLYPPTYETDRKPTL